MNTGIRCLSVASIFIILFSSSPVLSTVLRSGTNVEIPTGTTINDDLATSGTNVNIAGTVSGDVLAAGDQVNFTGSSSESSMLAGSYVSASGATGNDLYIAGGGLNIADKVADNAWLAGGTVNITNRTTVKRDLLAAGGDVTVAGHIGRNLRISGGKIFLNGSVGGNTDLFSDNINLGPNAVVHGNLIYTSSRPAHIANGAKVLGKTIYRHKPPTSRRGRVTGILLWLFSLISSFLVGAIILAISPVAAYSIADRLIHATWWSMLTGFIIFIAVPPAVVVLVLTLIGIPLAFITLALYAISIYISHIFAGLSAGRWIFSKSGRPATSLYLELLVGLPILWILIAIPSIGWLIDLAAIFLGLGALYSTTYERIRRRQQT